MPAGQNGRQLSRNESHSSTKWMPTKQNIDTNQGQIVASQERTIAEMDAWKEEIKAYPEKDGGKSRGNEVCSGT
jgi:hypothetical protein